MPRSKKPRLKPAKLKLIPKREPTDEIAFPEPDAENLKRILSYGLPRFYCRFISSDHSEITDGFTFRMLKQHFRRPVLGWYLNVEPARKVFDHFVSSHYIGDDRVIATTNGIRLLSGKYVVLCVPYGDSESPVDIESVGKDMAALLRIFLGEQMIDQMHYQYHREIEAHSSIWTARNAILVGFLENHLGEDFSEIRMTAFETTFDPRILQILEAAQAQHVRTLRFFQLWLAIEAQIGRGNARKDFCLGIMKSEELNAELFRLFKIRGSVVKTVAPIEVTAIDEYSLTSIIRLSMINDPDSRALLLDRYLTTLAKLKQDSAVPPADTA